MNGCTRWTVLAMLGALCALVALPAAGHAAPGGDAIVETTNVVIDDFTTGSGTAICPAGTRVVGGGINTTGPASGGTALEYVVQVSGPQDETGSFATTDTGDVARRWYASIFNRSGAPRLFKVFAVCSADSDAFVVVGAASLAPMSSGPAASGGATCPAGSRLTGGGGGVNVPPDDNVGLTSYALQYSGPVDESGFEFNTQDGDVGRKWVASLRNDTNFTREFRVLALCSRASDAVLEVQDVVAASGGSVATTAACPAGRRVLGGGLITTGPASLGDAFYFVQLAGVQDETGLTGNTDDGDVARFFYGYVHNVSGAPQTVKAVAICATNPAPGAPGGGGPVTGGPGGGPAANAPLCLGKRATIVGTARRDVLRGTPRADVIVALGGNDVIAALAGKDLVCAGAGNDRATGGAGADRLSGGPGNDSLGGGAGVDALLGGAGLDTLLGGAGRDALVGGPGRDRQVQ